MASQRIMGRLSTIYDERLGTPRARADWLLRVLQAYARAKSTQADRRWPPERFRLELSAFIRGTGWGGIQNEPATVLVSKEDARGLLDEVRDLFNEIRDGGTENTIEVRGWRATVDQDSRTGRLQIRPLLLNMDWQAAFWWQLAETLRAPEVRVAFCANATCRAPFVARKAQRYCQARCAPSGADRNRAYRQRHRDKLNRARRRRYDAALRAQHRHVLIKPRTER
jgi:hypothetical protein